MKQFIQTLLVILYVAICASITVSCQDRTRDPVVEIKILQTSDVHGAIFPYDFVRDRAVDHSLAQVYTYVKNLRDTSNAGVILLDNGDILQGQPTVYYSNFVDPGGPHICGEVMNYMHYDAATVGNHDIEAGHAVYDALIEQFEFPWLAANVKDLENGQTYFEPYTVIERHGIRIAILGLITPGIPNWLPRHLWDGMEFLDMVETADYWVPIILEKENPDLLVGLFHAGHDSSYGNNTGSVYMNENASLLVAQNVPGFDVIFIGHDHDTYNGFVRNTRGENVLILDPGSHARYISEATIRFEWQDARKEYTKQISGRLVETSLYDPDPEFMSKFSAASDEIETFVSRPLGRLNGTLSSSESLFGDDAFMDLIHRVQLEISGAQISFAAPLSFNATINSGGLRVRDFFQLYRFENFLYSMVLSGQEIDDYLEYSYGLWMNRMASPDDHLMQFETDATGAPVEYNHGPKYRLANPYYNFDSAEGIHYQVDVSKPPGQRVQIHSMMDGTDFDVNKRYMVAINSYRGNGGGGHLVDGAGIRPSELTDRVVFSTDHDLRYHMMHWIDSTGGYEPRTSGNWHVVPEDWWRKAVKKDSVLLFDQNQ
jgi:2',3'-cyclic-nucleotide 2'-phosphodiesterase/3'-nucleotidase